MKKKFMVPVAALSLATVLMCGLAGCNNTPIIGGGDEEVESNSPRIEVQCVVAGFGTDWLDAVAAEFNEMYKGEYEVVITRTDTNLNTINDICSPGKCTTDIFFEYNNINTLVNKSKSILKTGDRALLEDLTGVFNSPAIGKDKQPQGDNIIDRFSDSYVNQYTKYTGSLTGYDGYYGLPWLGGSQGLYISKPALVDNGYTLDDLLTTDSFLNVLSELAPADPLDTEAFFPVSWSETYAAGYWDYQMQIFFAQYEGGKSYRDFWDFVPDSGTVKDNGYSVYEKQGLYESLKVITEILNRDYAAPGTTSMDHVAAEARLAEGTSLVTVSGDWIYKELEKNYKDSRENIIAIKSPVISALGVKLNLCGKGTHAADEACPACDAILKDIVKDVDGETLTDAQIAEKHATVNEEAVKKVREARGIFLGFGQNTLAAIPSFSDAKVGAKLFLRYIYSDDGMKTFREHTYIDLPVSYVGEAPVAEKEFMQAMYERTHSSNSQMILNQSYTSKLRTVAGVAMFVQPSTLPATYSGLSYSHSSGAKPTYTPRSLVDQNVNYIKRSWSSYLAQAGIR